MNGLSEHPQEPTKSLHDPGSRGADSMTSGVSVRARVLGGNPDPFPVPSPSS